MTKPEVDKGELLASVLYLQPSIKFRMDFIEPVLVCQCQWMGLSFVGPIAIGVDLLRMIDTCLNLLPSNTGKLSIASDSNASMFIPVPLQ